MTKEGAMAAIVLDGKQPHQESGGRDGQRQGQPIADVEGRPRQHPKRGQRHDRNGNFDDAAAGARLAVAREKLRPGAGIRHSRGRSRGMLAVLQF